MSTVAGQSSKWPCLSLHLLLSVPCHLDLTAAWTKGMNKKMLLLTTTFCGNQVRTMRCCGPCSDNLNNTHCVFHLHYIFSMFTSRSFFLWFLPKPLLLQAQVDQICSAAKPSAFADMARVFSSWIDNFALSAVPFQPFPCQRSLYILTRSIVPRQTQLSLHAIQCSDLPAFSIKTIHFCSVSHNCQLASVQTRSWTKTLGILERVQKK